MVSLVIPLGVSMLFCILTIMTCQNQYQFPEPNLIKKMFPKLEDSTFCTINNSGIYNLTDLLNLPNFVLPNQLAYIMLEGNKVQWMVSHTIDFIDNESYHLTLDRDTYNNLQFLNDYLDLIYTIEFNPKLTILKHICGIRNSTQKVFYTAHDLDTLICYELNLLLETTTIHHVKKVQLVQNSGSRSVQVYLFYNNDTVIQDFIPKAFLTKIIKLTAKLTTTLSAITLEQSKITLATCGNKSDNFTMHEGHKLYHDGHKLCETIEKSGRYNIMLNKYDGHEHKFDNIAIHVESNNTMGSTRMSAQFIARFDNQINPSGDVIDLFSAPSSASMRDLLNFYNNFELHPSSMEFTDKFSIFICPNLEHNNCTIYFMSIKNGKDETLRFDWFQNLKVTQTPTGVNVSLVSGLYSDIAYNIWYPYYFVWKIGCTKVSTQPKVLCHSHQASFKLQRRLINCF